jgi:HlyD family secretion protein
MDQARLDQLRINRTEDSVKDHRGLWIAAALGVIVVAALLVWLIRRPDVPTVRVTAASELARQSRAAVLNASGYVTARRQATVSSKVTGKVIEVHVEEGMRVQQGQVLARLDPSMPTAAFRLSQAQAAAALSALEETRVRLEEAQLELRRAASMAAEKVASQQDVDRARAQVNAIAARLAAQREELEVAQRSVALRRQDLEDTVIRAPFGGVVVSKNAQPGEMISPMSAGGFTRTGICTIVDMDSLEIEVDVNEAYINRVTANQPVVAVLDAYPDWQIPAHVITTIPTADRQKATVRVRIGFDQRDSRVLPDMGVKVSFIAQDQGGSGGGAVSVAVPRTALRRDDEQDIVLVVRDQRVERRAVRVAGADGDNVVLQSGVSAGESVVIEGPAQLADGQRVKVTGDGQKN